MAYKFTYITIAIFIFNITLNNATNITNTISNNRLINSHVHCFLSNVH